MKGEEVWLHPLDENGDAKKKTNKQQQQQQKQTLKKQRQVQGVQSETFKLRKPKLFSSRFIVLALFILSL